MNIKAVDGFNFISKFTSRRIWNATKVVSSILRSRSEIDICTNCTEGCKVWT